VSRYSNGLHGTVSTSAFFAGDLIGFTTGLLITVLLLVLTLRAAKLPGTPLVNIGFAVCALLWCAGGLAQAACSAAGLSRQSHAALVAQAIQWSAVAAFPIAVLAVWRPFAMLAWQKTAARLLHVTAWLCAAAIALPFWVGAVHGTDPDLYAAFRLVAAYNAALLLLAGAFLLLRRRSTPRAVYLPSLAIVAAVCGAAVTMTMGNRARSATHFGAAVTFVGAHMVLLVVLCAFFLFARFRFADLFVRYGIRILLAGLWASMLAFFAQSAFLLHVARQSSSPPAVRVFGVIVLAAALLLSFTFVDERISRLVNRWLFRPPDYRAATRQLGHELGQLQLEPEIAAAVEGAACGALQLSGARLIAAGSLPPSPWSSALLEGELVELGYTDPCRGQLPLANAEVLIPVTSAGSITHVLVVSPGPSRPGLVTHDLNFLRAVAAQFGNRLDALHRERDAIERQSREALLLQQVAEAELRALRAQINPHFLFNSLNTIADLIVRDPPRAEAMTLRLASVFRHVLAHSSRSMTTIREEVEFLRTYLYIEEARFGDRLRVHVDMAPEAAGQSVPSLILQPLVENAMKHGLGPKPGPGNIWISARIDGDEVCVRIEDDGMGPQRVSAAAPNQCHGLTNVAARLRTLYGDGASVKLDARQAGGACVTVRIPLGEAGSQAV
jgi:two-component system, LytTR family, sensor kinase